MAMSRYKRWTITLAAFVTSSGLHYSVVHADITLDGTLGPSGALAGPDFEIPAEVGEQIGTNLFHSFGVFNVDTGESATFTGPTGIENVLGRVTGGEGSTINGLLSSEITGANLYLINPAGTVFGENAQLDVQGSFHTSTADYVRLGQDYVFSATNPQSSTLSVAPPSTFGFLSSNPAPISVRAGTSEAPLQVPQAETLSVIGGDVAITGGLLRAPSGRMNIASVASPGEVKVANENLGVDSFTQLGDIRVSRAIVSASGESGGAVVIRGGRLTIDNSIVAAATTGSGDGGLIDARIGGDLVVDNGVVVAGTFASGPAGTIAVDAGTVTIQNGGLIDTSSFETATGAAGRVTVDTDGELRVSGSNDQGARSGILAATFGTGDSGAGSVVLSASTLVIDETGFVAAVTTSDGAGGTIDIDAGNLLIADGGQIDASAFSVGDAGGVIIKADLVFIDAANDLAGQPLSGVFANARGGDAGPINIEAESVEIVGTSNFLAVVIDTRTFGAGRGGDLRVFADDLAVDGARIAAGSGGSGPGGDVTIETGQAALTGGAQIDSSSFASGVGGNVTLRATGDILISGRFDNTDFQSGLFSLSDGTGEGGDLTVITGGQLTMDEGRILTRTLGDADAGTLTVKVRNLTLTNGAQIFSGIGNASRPGGPGSETGVGRGGDLVVTVADTLTISGSGFRGFQSGLFTDAQVGQGAAGDLSVSAARLYINDGGTISTRSTGASGGDAGNILIQAADTVQLTNGSIQAATVQTDGGNIRLTVGRLAHLVDSEITTSVGDGAGRGGNINIDPEFVVLNDSRVVANAFGGPGGNIEIVAGQFLQTPTSVVDASSAQSIDGTVVIDSPDTDLSGSITRLPASFLNAAALLSRRCAARDAAEASSFVIVGRGGVPRGPDDWAFSSYGYDNSDAVAEVKESRGLEKDHILESTHAIANLPVAMIKVSCAR